jgi:hypothetical protein
MSKTYGNLFDRHEIVDILPQDAMSVSAYAKERGCTTSYVYHLLKRKGEAEFKIIRYQGINFVLPINK